MMAQQKVSTKEQLIEQEMGAVYDFFEQAARTGSISRIRSCVRSILMILAPYASMPRTTGSGFW